MHPVRSWPRQLGERERLRARFGDAGTCRLDLQDAIGSVGADERDHIQLLARLRPQRLQRVERAAIALEVDHGPVRTGDGGTAAAGSADANRAARKGESAV